VPWLVDNPSASPLPLHLRRWSRQASATRGGVLPVLLDVELGGIPAHLWGIDTAEHLIDGHCIVQGLHTDSVDGTDMSVLKLKAWGFSMDCLPSRYDLHVEEPTSIGEDGSCFPRTLIYSVSVKVGLSVALSDEEQPPPSSSDDDEDRDNKHQRQRPHLPGHQFSSVRTSVHARLGPRIASSAGRGRPVDAAPLLNASIDELQALVPSFPCNPSSPAVGTPVDAINLPTASVVELLAPGPSGGVSDVGPSPGCRSSTHLPLPAPDGESVVSLEETVVMALAPSSRTAQVPLESTFIMEGQPESGLQDITWAYKIRAKPPCFKVYARRRIPVQLTQSEENGSYTPLQKFKDGITKQTNGLLPAPTQPVKRKRKLIPSNFNLRRSRRVAKIPHELGSSSAAKVCRHLGFCDEKEHISFTFTDARRYAKLFESPLSREHITALAALFGWEVPPPSQF
jgi:hypothetical protein